MEEAPAMAIRRSDKAAPLPPVAAGSSRRRRLSSSAAASAWPAFPGDVAPGLGIGCAKRSPARSGAAAAAAAPCGNGDSSSCRSPFSSSGVSVSSSSALGGRGSGAAGAGAASRRSSSDAACARDAKSPGISKKSSGCDSFRPSSSKGSSRLEYSDVFGGPPKYFTSVSTGRNAPIPDYDDIFQNSNGSNSSARSTSTSTSSSSKPSSFLSQQQQKQQQPQQQSAKTKSRAAELPVFDLPVVEEDTGEVFKGPSVDKASVPLASATSPEEIAYDDVFGGPLTGPRTKLLKDLLRCSGFPEAKKKSGAKPKPPSSHSDSSTVSSIHSLCREPHGNPVYEYESEVYGDAKHFNSPLKSSLGSVEKSPQQRYVDLESSRKQPAVTSVSASSSPFTEQFDDSTVHSYSTRASKGAYDPPVAYEKAYRNVPAADTVNKAKTFGRAAEIDNASSSSSGSSESEYLRRKSAAKHAFKDGRKHRNNKARKPSRARREASHLQVPPNGHRSFGNGQLSGASGSPLCDSSAAEHDFDYRLENPSIKCFPRKTGENLAQKERQVQFVTVNHVQLTTEPTVLPPARPAPSKTGDFLSEKEMSEFLETEAFMEYSIKDLDGLVAEEYVVSQGSVSESSPSVSNSIKTSPSGRSYEDEDSDHCYAKDAVSPEPVTDKASGLEKILRKTEEKQDAKTKVASSEEVKSESSQETAEDKNPEPAVQIVENKHPEETSSASTSSEEHPKCISSTISSTNGSGDLSSLCDFEVVEGENPDRRKSRWERHQRAVERVAKALAEKNNRDLELERVQEEKLRVAELLDDVIKRWAAGKQGNLRALLSTLQYILWPECGWQPISLIDIIEPASVRKAYRKATLYVHPDKLQQKNASTEHKYIAEKVFDLLQEAWTSFNFEQAF